MRTDHWDECPAAADHHAPVGECECAVIEADAREMWADMLMDMDREDSLG